VDKQELLERITLGVRDGRLSRDEVLQACDNAVQKAETTHREYFGAVLRYLGAGVIALGVITLVLWGGSELDSFSRILVALGCGLLAFIGGVIADRTAQESAVDGPLFLISGLVVPVGLCLFFSDLGYGSTDLSAHVSASIGSALLFGSGFLFLRKSVLLLFAALSAGWLFFSLTGQLADSIGYPFDRAIGYCSVAVGLAYCALGFALVKTQHSSLTGAFNALGATLVLGAALLLGGWPPNESALWELAFPFIAFAFIYFGTKTRTRGFLTGGVLFLMAYIVKMSAEYFGEGLGWPFAIVIAGLLILVVGTLTLRAAGRLAPPE
jgi:hypothetical protein